MGEPSSSMRLERCPWSPRLVACLQERRIERVGEIEPGLNVRFVSAANKDLKTKSNKETSEKTCSSQMKSALNCLHSEIVAPTFMNSLGTHDQIRTSIRF